MVSRTDGKSAGSAALGDGEGCEVAVGGRQDDDVGGVLPEIARDIAVVDAACGAELQMHAAAPLFLQRPPHGVAVKALQADHDQMLGRLQRPDARTTSSTRLADRLHDHRRLLVLDPRIAFDAQHAVEAECVATWSRNASTLAATDGLTTMLSKSSWSCSSSSP